jgi:hypothetical protein
MGTLPIPSKAEPPSLSRDDFDFFSRPELVPKEDQFDAWLCYEFGRSYGPLVKAVRSVQPKAKTGVFQNAAWTLAHDFPEFPETPWVRIPNSKRQAWLAACQKEMDEGPAAGSRALHFTPLREFMCDVLPELYAGELERNRWVVLNINFAAQDEEIVSRFQAELQAYRKVLIKRFDKAVEARCKDFDSTGKNVINHSDYFRPRKQRGAVGRGSKLGQLKSLMKRLAALRLMHHYGNKWVEAEVASAYYNPKGKALYTEERSWRRSQREAAALMLRFAHYWKQGGLFVTILDHAQFRGTILAGLAQKLVGADEQSKSTKKRVEELLANDIAGHSEPVRSVASLDGPIDESE